MLKTVKHIQITMWGDSPGSQQHLAHSAAAGLREKNDKITNKTNTKTPTSSQANHNGAFEMEL